MALINCPVCGKEISETAAVCPNCGAKRKKKHTALAIVLIVLGVIGLASTINSIDKPENTTENTETRTVLYQTQNETPKEVNVGVPAEIDNVIVTLKNVIETSGSEFNKSAEGNVFAICEFEIENNSDHDVNVSSILSFEAYCDDYAENLSLAALAEKGSKNQLDGIVASGKKFSGVVGYEIPADWGKLEIKFTPSFWNGRDVTFIANH